MPTCRQCQAAFDTTRDDLAFYEKISPVFGGKKETIPPPALCPDCRDQRRYAFRNERHIYRRPCHGCKRDFISIYAPEKPWIVYCPSCFFSDAWDARTFGKDFDFSRTFFEQFLDMKKRVPRLGIDILKSENCDYTNISPENKDCYLAFATARSERCIHTRKIGRGKDCIDCSQGEQLELCYDCVDCSRSYRLFSSENCVDCSDSAFLFDCRGTRNCFLCSNLRNKQYCILNRQTTPEEYARRMHGLRSYAATRSAKEEFSRLKSASIHRENQNFKTEGCTGDYLLECRNCRHCFDIHHSEDCAYCNEAITGARSCMDCSFVTMECEWDFECCSCSSGTSFSCFATNCRDANEGLLYSDTIYSSRSLFGCIGMRRGQHCILNKQYTKDRYEELVPRIIAHMRATNEWGAFFPSAHSPFAYNESIVQEFYPLRRDQALEKGFAWRDVIDEPPKAAKTLDASQLPDSIDDIPDDILQWAIRCGETKRLFKIVRQELDFYRRMGLPIPRLHPDERHRRRMALRNPRKLWKRNCAQCGKEMETTYPPERPEIVYCENCYLKEVY